MTAESILAELTRPPSSIDALRTHVPDEPGFYAWWLIDRAALPTVPVAENGLLYVGIAPSRATSNATMRSRLLDQHLGNALGSSTLRRGLAAFLWEREGWRPIKKGRKPGLPAEQLVALTRWQEQNLRVSWCCVDEPWRFEPALIGKMRPPLNSDHNHEHPFYPTLREARRHLLAVARSGTP